MEDADEVIIANVAQMCIQVKHNCVVSSGSLQKEDSMRIHYNKLVRDAIPAMIEQEGKTCCTSTLSAADYQLALRAKLVEEAGEAKDATPDQLKEELADL